MMLAAFAVLAVAGLLAIAPRRRARHWRASADALRRLEARLAVDRAEHPERESW